MSLRLYTMLKNNVFSLRPRELRLATNGSDNSLYPNKDDKMQNINKNDKRRRRI